MLPADEDVAVAVVGLDSLLDTLLVGLVTGGIHGETQLFGEGLDGFVWAFTGTIYTGTKSGCEHLRCLGSIEILEG